MRNSIRFAILTTLAALALPGSVVSAKPSSAETSDRELLKAVTRADRENRKAYKAWQKEQRRQRKQYARQRHFDYGKPGY